MREGLVFGVGGVGEEAGHFCYDGGAGGDGGGGEGIARSYESERLLIYELRFMRAIYGEAQ